MIKHQFYLMGKKLTTHFGDLSLIDLMYARPEEDCAVLVLVTAGYIDGTPENQTDLLDKMEGYLRHKFMHLPIKIQALFTNV